jgi:hypothetical protein
MPSNADVAKWMLDEVKRDGELPQEYAASEIQDRFGDDFVYENENGNLAISKGVLKEFRKFSERDVVWERGSRSWRPREAGDEPGRQAD